MPSINESKLEQTFGELAFASLRDAAQGLLDYLVGFQMLRQEDDGARAVGMFAFEIDDDFYFVPTFFLNGEIRGLDTIYSQESDLFMPLTDEWVSTLINRRHVRLGEANKDDRRKRGVGVPNYMRLKTVPGGGGSSNLKIAAAMMGSRDDNFEAIDTPTALRLTGCTGIFKEALYANPRLREAFEQFYQLDDLYDAEPEPQAKLAADRKPVTIITTITDEGIDRLSDEQRKTLVAGGVAVIDDRPEIEKSVLYSTETQKRLENPTSDGLYDVLWADGSVRTAVISHTSDPAGTVFVYQVDTGKHCTIDPSSVYAVRKYSAAEYEAWLEKNAEKPSNVRSNDVVVFLCCKGGGSGGLCLRDRIDGLDDTTVFTVNDAYFMQVRSHSGCAAPIGSWSARSGGYAPMDEPNAVIYGHSTSKGLDASVQQDPNKRVRQVIVRPTGGKKLVYLKDKLIVNDDCMYALRLNRFSLDDKDTYVEEDYSDSRVSMTLELSDFGDYNTVVQQLRKVSTELKVWKTGSDVNVADDKGRYTFTKRAGLIDYCMNRLGLGEADAKLIADVDSRSPTTFQVKKAEMLLELPELEDESYGNEMSAFVQSQIPWRGTRKRNPEDNREFYRYNSPFGPGSEDDTDVSTLDTIQTAAQTGQKDVFDAAALSSLMKAHAPTELVDRFIPTMTSGMDRLGRILFLIFWHYKDFEERYGEDDLGEFIDNLRSTMKSVGDIIIFAKKRSLAGDPSHYGLGLTPAEVGD